MARALISSENGLLRNALGWAVTLIVIPVAIVVALIVKLFDKPIERSATEVAEYLRNFLDGQSGEWDWDDFTSIPIADAELESLRERAVAIDLPMTDAGLEQLKALVAEAEALAASHEPR